MPFRHAPWGTCKALSVLLQIRKCDREKKKDDGFVDKKRLFVIALSASAARASSRHEQVAE